MTTFDEDYLWSLGLLGCENPENLLNTVMYLVGKGFALCAGKEHHVLRSPPFDSQFKFHHDNSGTIFLRYKEDIGFKN